MAFPAPTGSPHWHRRDIDRVMSRVRLTPYVQHGHPQTVGGSQRGEARTQRESLRSLLLLDCQSSSQYRHVLFDLDHLLLQCNDCGIRSNQSLQRLCLSGSIISPRGNEPSCSVPPRRAVCERIVGAEQLCTLISVLCPRLRQLPQSLFSNSRRLAKRISIICTPSAPTEGPVVSCVFDGTLPCSLPDTQFTQRIRATCPDQREQHVFAGYRLTPEQAVDCAAGKSAITASFSRLEMSQRRASRPSIQLQDSCMQLSKIADVLRQHRKCSTVIRLLGGITGLAPQGGCLSLVTAASPNEGRHNSPGRKSLSLRGTGERRGTDARTHGKLCVRKS